MARPDSPPPPSRASLKAWWKQFTTSQRVKKDFAERELVPGTSRVFGVPLRDSLQYASVQISTANANGELYVWGYIPVVVAKCGLYLKENATEVAGTFRVSGSSKRMRELQALFEAPPRYGKALDLKQGHYTTHDVASVFRRYLTLMPEPVIPHELYHDFRNALSKAPFNQDECIHTYKRLIRSLPRANQYLLLYVLDLLSVFARKSETNLMTATNLAVIFRPGIISHPDHELSPDQHKLSQDVLEFLIAHQDWFMLDIPPPPASTPSLSSAVHGDGVQHSDIDDDDMSALVVYSSEEENNGWRMVERREKHERGRQLHPGRLGINRRTASASERSSGPSSPMTPTPMAPMNDYVGGLVEGDMGESPATPTGSPGPGAGVTRSRTMPARPRARGEAASTSTIGEDRQRKVLKKGRGGRANPPHRKDDSG
ncbi:Rho GTPase activation protein [Gautieria morchelliformis]|nr:Rho GTPase activation protein [Gautieria morchelliformis]